MQQAAALLASAFVAASGMVTGQPALHRTSALATPEVYIAELDADWNVAREVRRPCDPGIGCTIDFGGQTDGATLRVRFDAGHDGRVHIRSTVENLDGGTGPERSSVVSLDATGFGATHYEAEAAAKPAGSPARVIMVAVSAPGWLADSGTASPHI